MILKGVKGKEKQKQDAEKLRKTAAYLLLLADDFESGKYLKTDIDYSFAYNGSGLVDAEIKINAKQTM